jgi:hypothetical protein
MVASQLAPSQDLGHGARGLPAPQFELEEPVLRRRVALREEEVLLVLGVDVVDAPPIAPDLDGLVQPGHAQRGRRRR